ncbi:hypothetical protein BDR26DRAFT_915404 [Obelidium mucronatum]|nr:hypothetical protein BDR26DRAFT_915404 [Obelidium mucronatum]
MQLLVGIVALIVSSLVAAAPISKRSSSVIFAPYLDATTNYDPTPYFKATGTKHFTLAFVTADGNGNPQWNGISTSSKWYADRIATIRAFGGDVSISFGGAAGTELGVVAKDATTLANTYLNVLNTYNVNWADFDIEGESLKNLQSVEIRNQAIAIMQAKQPNLKISYTLPVQTDGLDAGGINLVQNAAKNKVKIDILNIMVMDYYENIPYFDANGKSLMGQYAISATQGTFAQVGSLVDSIGMCAMIGINDDVKEVFTLADATQMANFAAATSYISWVSFWVVGADVRGNVDGLNAASGAYAKAIIAGLGNQSQATSATTATKTFSPVTSTKTTTTTTTPASNCYAAWTNAAPYNGGAQVSYNNFNYVAKWWAAQSDVPGTADVWNAVGACGGATTTTAKSSSTTTTTTTTTAKPSTSSTTTTTTTTIPTKSTTITTTTTTAASNHKDHHLKVYNHNHNHNKQACDYYYYRCFVSRRSKLFR